MKNNTPGLTGLILKTIVAHTITYFLMGILASNLLDYAERFSRAEMVCWMRQVNDPLIMAGVLFQPIRGLLFALVFYLLRQVFFAKPNGWLIMWCSLVVFGILSTFGPSPGSIEGMVYTVIPLSEQFIGLLEVIPQAFLLSLLLYYWVNHPEKKWMNWTMGVIFFIVLLLPVLGLLSRS